MANPSPQYGQAEAKGRVLFERPRRRLNDPNTHDGVQTDIEINYELEYRKGVRDLGTTALENALFKETIGKAGESSRLV